MKTTKLALIVLGCTAIPAFAQDGMQCGATNFDSNRNLFTITNPSPGSLNQQCFINVLSKQEWSGGQPDFSRSQLVEGSYEISLSGGGGGSGGAARASSGYDGADAVSFTQTRYLSPGVYRLTIGSGGQGGQACLTEEQGGRGGDGAPTSVSEAYSGQTIAGYPRAENWAGSYPSNLQVASGRRLRGADVPMDGNTAPAVKSGDLGGGGRGPAGNCEMGTQGGNGFIKLALVTAAAPAAPAPAPAVIEREPAPAPAPSVRPTRKDRN